jgi:dsRNA-specific ribonuclease
MASRRQIRKAKVTVGEGGELVQVQPQKPKDIGKFTIEGRQYNHTSWRNAIKENISDILSKFMKPKEMQNFTNDKAMTHWEKAFTHESVDYNNNYELFEHYGDVVLKYLFTKYLITIYPGLKVSGYSRLQHYYQARGPQGRLSLKLGFMKLLRIRGIIDDMEKVRGDMFESFFGALSTIADESLPGLGAAVCYNVIVTVYDDEEIDIRKIELDPKSKYVQIFQRHGYTRGLEEITEIDNGIKLSVMVPYDANAFLKSNGIDIGDGTVIIAEGTGFSDQEIRDRVYEEALTELVKFGVTPEWSEMLKKGVDRSSADNVLLNDAMEKAKNEGFTDIYFSMDNKTPDKSRKVYQLYGITSNDKEILLANYKAQPTESDIDGRNGVLKNYLK